MVSDNIPPILGFKPEEIERLRELAAFAIEANIQFGMWSEQESQEFEKLYGHILVIVMYNDLPEDLQQKIADLISNSSPSEHPDVAQWLQEEIGK